jgi:hypothetical protein
MAGALADMINLTMPAEFADPAVKRRAGLYPVCFGRAIDIMVCVIDTGSQAKYSTRQG